MLKVIVIGLLVVFFIYMVVWSLQLHFHEKRQEKVKRVRQLREKTKEVAKETIPEYEKVVLETPNAIPDVSQNYWLNRKDLEMEGEQLDASKCFHYFDSVEDAVHDLLLEMYDYGIVRVDELEQIAYGDDHLKNVDLSFLDEMDRDDTDLNAKDADSVLDDDVITVEGMSDFLFKKPSDVLDAAKNLKKDDPGIKDIHGTLSEGVEKVIEAVDKEKAIEAKKNEPISQKKEESLEEARRNRARTSKQDIRSQVFDRWSRYVFELYEMVEIHADETMLKQIKKQLHDYGFNDVSVLLKSPD